MEILLGGGACGRKTIKTGGGYPKRGKEPQNESGIERQRKGEAAFATGIPIKEKEETKKNVVAHKEFLRVTKLLNKIEKCDALYENIINRYCLLYAECRDFEEKAREIL